MDWLVTMDRELSELRHTDNDWDNDWNIEDIEVFTSQEVKEKGSVSKYHGNAKNK